MRQSQDGQDLFCGPVVKPMKKPFWRHATFPAEEQLVLIRENRGKSVTGQFHVHVGWYHTPSGWWSCLSRELADGTPMPPGRYASLTIANIDGWMPMGELA